MCGRFAMNLDPNQIREILNAQGFKIKKVEDEPKVGTGLNKAPQSYSMVYCQDDESKEPELVAMKWMLQPSWARTPIRYPTFNTRSESLSPLKPAWRSATHRRGILPMQGYYEWDQHTHLPYYIHNKPSVKKEEDDLVKVEDGEQIDIKPDTHSSTEDQDILYCLVIWDVNPKLCEVPTFSIITGPAAPRLAEIHDRMPVIMRTREEAEEWITGKWPNVLELIRPNEALECYRVTKDVNKVGVEKPGLNLPLKETKSNKVSDFFSPRKRHAEKAHPIEVKEESGHKIRKR